MKRFFTLLMAAAGLMACTRTSFEEQMEMPGEFTASIESIDTKTSMDGLRVLWSSGDQVSVFSGMNINEQYQVSKSSAGKSSASFSKVSGSDGFGSAIPANVGYYPYSSDVEVSWESGKAAVYSSIPSVQAYKPDSFGQGSFPMMAVTTNTSDKDFAFKNVCGVLKLQLTGTQKVESIVFQGNDDEVVSGDAVITSSYAGTPSIQMTGNGKTVTLDCGAGVQLSSTPSDFNIVLPPMTFSKGFTVTVTETDGKTMEISTDKSQTIVRSEILKMPSKEYDSSSSIGQPSGELCFTAEEAGSTVALNTTAMNGLVKPYDVPQEYCIDGEHWYPYILGTPITLAKVGDKVYFRKMTDGVAEGFSKKDGSASGYYQFEMSGIIAASGNVMSLVDRTCKTNMIPNDYCFFYLFLNCSSLTQAPELPATTLGEGCYNAMFAGCTSLTKAPELPATTLARNCYYGMFNGCTSLTKAPDLTATTLAGYCYYGMFQNCTSLTQAPNLPATTLASSCYRQMFAGCTSLIQAPELSATTLADHCCYHMFTDCTSLTEAPELLATTLASSCYLSMFVRCTSLVNAPELRATTLAEACYSYMFYDCTSLSEVRCFATDLSASAATTNWLSGVASTGTFYADPSASWTRGVDGIPTGWTVKSLEGTNNGHEYVDLGLSVKWATMNVGATKPEEYGDYFAWGATEPWYQPGYAQEDPQKHWKSGYTSGYTWNNTPYQTVNTTNFNSTRWTKYVGRTTSSFKDASATDEDALKTVLDPEDDAAHACWGGTWRMPTFEECTELLNECTWTWTTLGGVHGYKVQSNKSGYADKWIFLPAAGQRAYGGLDNLGTVGYYLSSSMDNNPLLVFLVEFNLNTLYRSSDYRNYGRSVRPVTE